MSEPVNSLRDLFDGLLLREFLSKVYVAFRSEEPFKDLDLNPDCKTEWPVRLGNLQKLRNALKSYLLSLGISHLREDVDLLAIAVNQDSVQITKLLEEVMCAAIHSQNKEAMILTITHLTESTQLELMDFIQKVLAKGEGNPIELLYSMSPTKEITRLKEKESRLSSQLEQIRNERDLVSQEKAKIVEENMELQLTNTDLKSALFIRPKRRMMTPDTIALQLEAELTCKERMLFQLKQEMMEQQRKYEGTVATLKDEIDVANEKLGALTKVEAGFQKQKKTIEELTPLRSALKDLKNENELLKRRLQKYESEEFAIQSLSKQLAQSKDLLSKEKLKCHTLEDKIQQREQQLKDANKSCTEVQEKLRVSESKCKEMGAQVDRLMAENGSEDSFSQAAPVERGFSRRDTMTALMLAEKGLPVPRQKSMDTVTPEMKERKMREFFILTYENAELKADKEKLGQELEQLKHLYETETASDTAKFSAVSHVYEEEISSMSEALKASEASIRDLRKSHSEEVTQLKASVRVLELQQASLESEIGQLKAEREALTQELGKTYRDKDEITSKYLSCRDETLHLHRDLAAKTMKVNSLELERNLYKDRVTQMETRVVQAPDNDSLLSLQLENLETERKTYSLKSRISELEYEVKDKDEWVQKVAVEEAQIKELQERLTRLKSEASKKDMVISYLRKEKEEYNNALMKERQLMKEVLREMNGTMMDIHGLVEVRGSIV